MRGPKDEEELVATCDGNNGRNNKPIAFRAKFIGYYGTDPNDQNTVKVSGTWLQDTIDIIRQEYVDMTPTVKGDVKKAELPVPDKGSFVDTISTDNGVDSWNTGHYDYMIDDGLKGKKAAWLAEVNEERKSNNLSVFTDTDFQVNSAYRNPYHQRFHVGGGVLASFHSRHPYGDALDIHTLDVDGDGTTEQVRKSEAKSDDGVAMERAAQDAGALWTASWEYYGTHTHADWTLRTRDGGNWPPPAGTVYSPPCDIDGTAASGPSVTPVQSSGSTEEEPDEGNEGGTQETLSATATVSPSNGSYSASAGDSHTIQLSLSEPYYDVSFYVRAPGETSGRGSYVGNVSGDGTSTTASWTYTFPTSVSGDYVITAALIYRWSDMSLVDSEPSYTVSVSEPITPLIAPTAPSRLAAAYGNAEVTLSWTAPTSSGSSQIIRYEYRYATGQYPNHSAFTSWTSTGSTSAYYVVTGLTNGTQHLFQVRAVNNDNMESGTTNTAFSTPRAPLVAPTAPSSLTARRGNGQATLSWTAPTSSGSSQIIRYEYRYATGQYPNHSAFTSWTSTGSTNTTYVVTGLTSGTQHLFQVRAVNNDNMESGTTNTAFSTPQ